MKHGSLKANPVDIQGNRFIAHDLFRDLAKAKAILSDNIYRDNPLLPELQFIADRYMKLAKRFERVIKISDSYQSELWSAYQKLELASRTDDLTGLFNRRDMMSRLTYEVKEAALTESTDKFPWPYLFLIDIDNFKDVNDHFGHATGDRVLIELARLMKDEIGSQGVVARWGGEEFLVLYNGCCDASALTVGENLRRHIASRQLSAADGTVFSTTVSIGISRLIADMSVDCWLHAADTMLYAAKHNGRNRCSLAE